MVTDVDPSSISRKRDGTSAGSREAGVSIAVICAALLTLVGAGFAVVIGPRGLGDTTDTWTPLREAALRVSGGSDRAGEVAIRANGCGDCHSIPGILRGERLPDGPSLERYADRPTIAGTLPNRPENLVIWLQEPERFTPETKMAGLALDSRTAGDVAAYLYRN